MTAGSSLRCRCCSTYTRLAAQATRAVASPRAPAAAPIEARPRGDDRRDVRAGRRGGGSRRRPASGAQSACRSHGASRGPATAKSDQTYRTTGIPTTPSTSSTLTRPVAMLQRWQSLPPVRRGISPWSRPGTKLQPLARRHRRACIGLRVPARPRAPRWPPRWEGRTRNGPSGSGLPGEAPATVIAAEPGTADQAAARRSDVMVLMVRSTHAARRPRERDAGTG